MKQELDLIKILEGHEGCELYSTIYGPVIFKTIYRNGDDPIICELKDNRGCDARFSKQGKIYSSYKDSECILFPSKDVRDWDKFENYLIDDAISKISTYEDACEEIGVEPMDEECLLKYGFTKGDIAYKKLEIISKAWNKMCDFVPDFTNMDQKKWFPILYYQISKENIIYSNIDYDTSLPSIYGSTNNRLYFKNYEIADKFRKKYIDLWNILLAELNK